MNFDGQRKLKILFLSTITFLFLPVIAAAFIGKIAFINTTASAPEGVYVRSMWQSLDYGDYVVVVLEKDMPSLGAEKGFLLLKRVGGLSGDSYVVNEEALSIHGRNYPIFHRGDLPKIELGDYIVPPDSVLLLNETEDSFDSRYLGTAPKSNIISKVFLFLPFKPFYNFAERVRDL